MAAARRAILRTYFLLAGLYTLAASLIWGVNTLFLLDAGLSISEVFVANAAFSAGMVVFEIPTGVVADTLGRRASYLASIVVLAVTTVGYLAAAQAGAGVGVFVAWSVLMGLGFTFYSGALEAWLVDGLADAGGADADLDHVFARGQQVTGAAMLVGTVAGGAVGQLDLAAPFVIRTVLLVGLGVVAASRMHDIGFTPKKVAFRQIPTAMAIEARSGISYGWANPSIRLLMVSGSVRMGFFAWGFYASQPYFLELLERDAVWVVGIITAAMSLATIAGNQIVEVLSRRCRRRTTLLAWGSGTATAALVVMGATSSFAVAVAAFLVAAGALGVMSPVRSAYIHHETPSEHRATVLSFDSLVSSAAGVGGQVGLGAYSDRAGLGAGYVVGGGLTVVALPVLALLRRRGDRGDMIVGRAGSEQICAGAGLPANAAAEPVEMERV